MDRFCGITGELDDDTFGLAARVHVPPAFEQQMREARAFLGKDGHTWQLDRQNAYLPIYTSMAAGASARWRVVSRAPVSPRIVRSFERGVLGLSADLRGRLAITEIRVSDTATRMWVEVDWHGLINPRLAIKQGELEPDALFDEMIAILLSLERHHVVHGGIGPAHLRWRPGDGASRKGALCLTHFGLPHLLAAQRRTVLPALGTSVGDPRYMAPEVAFGLPPDPMSDRYSAAASYAALLSDPDHAPGGPLLGLAGARARAARSPEEWIRGIAENMRRRIDGRVLEQLWLMLEPQPRDRRPRSTRPPREAGRGPLDPADASRMALPLQRVSDAPAATTRSLAVPTPAQATQSPRPASARLFWAVGTGTVGVLALVIYLVLSRSFGTAAPPLDEASVDTTTAVPTFVDEPGEPPVMGPPLPPLCDLGAAVASARRALAFDVLPKQQGGQVTLAPIHCARIPLDKGSGALAGADGSHPLGCCKAVLDLRQCAEAHESRPLMTYRLPEGPLAKQRVTQLRRELERCGMADDLTPADVSGLDVSAASFDRP